ncbi:Alpha/Beta hydrolase protein [Mycena polygramma]|nr:Alpha/Beta hydrolase protein [Mycena polygramma]
MVLDSLHNLVCAALIFLASLRQVDSATAPVVDLGYAKYQGVVDTARNITAFRGIRYAAPPTGNLRWQAPAAPLQVDGIQLAFDDPPQCYQGALGTSSANPASVRDVVQSEDCLFVSVYTPASNYTAPLPTIVWIHGGGYVMGSASQYNGAEIVQESKNQVVVVVIQYRLGLFGFLAGQEIKDGGVLNTGLLDQDFALRWVNKNIRKFGKFQSESFSSGDPNQVILWGQSHIIARNGTTSPQLFKAVITSSNFLPSQYQYNSRIPQTVFNTVASQAGCSGENALDCLRGVEVATWEDINLKVIIARFQGTLTFGPVIDGSFITQSPTDALLNHGKLNGDILLSVTNTNEGVIFVDQTQDYNVAEYVRNLFPLFGVEESNAAAAIYKTVGSPLDQVNAIMGESVYTCSTYLLLDAFPGQAYKGQYTIPPATHGQDVINYFTSFDGFNITLIYNNTDFINAFSQIFVSFAANLDPNHTLRPSITPVWPKWSRTAEAEMVFNKTELGVPHIALANTSSALLERCEFWRSMRCVTSRVSD